MRVGERDGLREREIERQREGGRDEGRQADEEQRQMPGVSWVPVRMQPLL